MKKKNKTKQIDKPEKSETDRERISRLLKEIGMKETTKKYKGKISITLLPKPPKKSQ